MARAELPPLPVPHRPVRRLDHASTADIRHAIDEDEPVLLVGAVGRVPLFDRLRACAGDRERLAVLAEVFGEREVPVSLVATDGRMPSDERRVDKMRFAELARRLGEQLDDPGSDRLYMQHQPVRQFPELDWRPPALASDTRWEHAVSALWVGAGGQIVNLHCDNTVNLVCMAAGVKRFALLPYEVLPDIYPVLDPLQNVSASSARLLRPDWERFPRFARAVEPLQTAVIEPGDVLVVPPHWWHHVESFGLNVMVSNRFFPFEAALWHAIGSNRVEAIEIFSRFAPAWRERYAARYDQRVFGRPAADADAPPPATGAPPADAIERAERNLATAADLFDRVPAMWRRHGRASYRYFVFQASGPPMDHEPGAFEHHLAHLQASIQRGDPVPALG